MISVSIAGKPLSDPLMAALTSVEVELELNLPASCTVEVGTTDVESSGWQAVDLRTFPLGSAMEVGFGPNPVTVFRGKLGELEANFSKQSTVELRGFDLLYELQFGTAQATYEGLSDFGIAAKIAERRELPPPQGDESSPTYPYLLQANQSDFAFLATRAARINFELLANGNVLIFRESKLGQDPKVTLEWKSQLLELNASVRALKQGSTVTRVGWDPRTKDSLIGSVSSGSASLLMGGSQTGYQRSAGFAASPTSATDPEILDPASAKTFAQAAYDAGLNGFIEAKATVRGDPRLVAGINVALTGIGPTLTGPYYVHSARHVYTPKQGYLTYCGLWRTGA